MLSSNRILYSLRDVAITPSETTRVKSRSQCNPYSESIDIFKDEKLPLITAPMSCVINENNYKEFMGNKINVVIPRTVDKAVRLKLCKEVFCSFSLQETKELFLDNTVYYDQFFILIDVANGGMISIFDLGRELKNKYNNKIHLMGGNIANPGTYTHYKDNGFEYVRVGIGGGHGCLSSTNTGVHYPMASLLNDIVKSSYECKIIADGGMSSYSDIIKSLALGADYVMCGMLFSKAALSNERIGDYFSYMGMSTKECQLKMGKNPNNLHTSEGKYVNSVKEYTLSGWVENFTDYLRSSMSYCDSFSLREFKDSKLSVISHRTDILINDK